MLLLEIKYRKYEFENTPVKTIYFGGGTPSSIPIYSVKKILSTIRELYQISIQVEITFEVNPDDCSVNYLEQLKQLGVTRLSIGIQSFFDEDLVFFNRSHNSTQAKQVIEDSKKIFDNLSIDLIYGVPKEKTNNWVKNINLFLEYSLPHLSAYALTQEPKTLLNHKIKKKEITLPDDNKIASDFFTTIDLLEKHGYMHYELSNFGMEGYWSMNNLNYWNGGSYLGFGPSAHSLNKGIRKNNISNIHQYMSNVQSKTPYYKTEILDKNTQYNEYVLTRMRTANGCSTIDIKKLFGNKLLDYFTSQTHALFQANHLKKIDQHIVINKKSKFLTDYIISELFYV